MWNDAVVHVSLYIVLILVPEFARATVVWWVPVLMKKGSE